MFNLHGNRTQQESHPSPKRSRIRAGVLGAGVAMTVAVSALGVGMAGAASAATASDTTTITHHGIELPSGHSTYLPRMVCPKDYPYLLNQQYNAGTGFRIGHGIEFTDWKWGFDVVALSYLRERTGNGDEYIRTGITGDHDKIFNSATNWGPSPTGWTLTLHCTSNPDKGIKENH
jgi:hypothetical protein